MGTFVEGESMFYDGQGREPAGCSFLPGGCLALCILLDSLFVNTLAVIRLRWLSSGCVGVELFEPCSYFPRYRGKYTRACRVFTAAHRCKTRAMKAGMRLSIYSCKTS